MNYHKRFEKHLATLRERLTTGPSARFFRDSCGELHYGIPESELVEMAHKLAQDDLDNYSSIAA